MTLIAASVLQPVDATPPLTGQALATFFQPWFVALSGLSPKLVRPAFQPEPPVFPDFGNCCMFFRFSTRPADDWPYIGFNDAARGGRGASTMQRHVAIDILCSFYDMGIGGQAEAAATLFKDNMAVPQNVEYLLVSNFGLASVGALQVLPVLIKSRWQYRVDFGFVVRYEMQRTYPVDSVEVLQGTVVTDIGVTESL
jgi:hypothetical protein